MVKPCKMPCAKCGSTDVTREFHPKGSYLCEPYRKDYEKQYKGFVVRNLFETPKVTKDFIAHHCRDCQHEWATNPLSKSATKQEPTHEQA